MRRAKWCPAKRKLKWYQNILLPLKRFRANKMIIEYRHSQGENLAALIKLYNTDKYWNFDAQQWGDMLPVPQSAYVSLTETKTGIYTANIEELIIAEGALYSIEIYSKNLIGTEQADTDTNGDGVINGQDATPVYSYELLSSTTRLSPGAKTFLEIINEVQRRISYPLSKTLNEPNARKIGAFTNDIIGMILAAGNQTFNLKTDYSVILRAGTNAINVFPANCYGIQNIKSVYIDQKPILLLQAFPNRTIGEFNKPAILPNGNPMKYIVKSVSQYNTILQFDQKPVTDKTVDLEIIEKPAKLENATDTCVFDSDLVIKGVEYLMRDEVGLGGDVPGRVLFQEYLTATMNSTADPNWETLHA